MQNYRKPLTRRAGSAGRLAIRPRNGQGGHLRPRHHLLRKVPALALAGRLAYVFTFPPTC